MQVASRLLLVWGVGYNFPETTKYSPAYSSMLVAWSITEVVRYSYFVFVLSGQGVPRLWTWLRSVFPPLRSPGFDLCVVTRTNRASLGITRSSSCTPSASRARRGLFTRRLSRRKRKTSTLPTGFGRFWRLMFRVSTRCLRIC